MLYVSTRMTDAILMWIDQGPAESLIHGGTATPPPREPPPLTTEFAFTFHGDAELATAPPPDPRLRVHVATQTFRPQSVRAWGTHSSPAPQPESAAQVVSGPQAKLTGKHAATPEMLSAHTHPATQAGPVPQKLGLVHWPHRQRQTFRPQLVPGTHS
jgi:hypothetical protein